MINDILSGIPWGIFLSFMIGPVFFILLETSIIKGFRAAIVFDLGVVLGDIVFISIAYLGIYVWRNYNVGLWCDFVYRFTQRKESRYPKN